MISKRSVILQKLSMVIAVGGYMFCILILPDPLLGRSVFLAMFVGSCIWHVLNTICPHCKRVNGLKPKPFAQNAGICIHCHKQVDYK